MKNGFVPYEAARLIEAVDRDYLRVSQQISQGEERRTALLRAYLLGAISALRAAYPAVDIPNHWKITVMRMKSVDPGNGGAR